MREFMVRLHLGLGTALIHAERLSIDGKAIHFYQGEIVTAEYARGMVIQIDEVRYGEDPTPLYHEDEDTSVHQQKPAA